jgi:hypothetical protein
MRNLTHDTFEIYAKLKPSEFLNMNYSLGT